MKEEKMKTIKNATIYNGDCLEILPKIAGG